MVAQRNVSQLQSEMQNLKQRVRYLLLSAATKEGYVFYAQLIIHEIIGLNAGKDFTTKRVF